MNVEREYYLVGGRDLERINSFIVDRDTSLDQVTKVAEMFGGEAVHNGRCIVGIITPEHPIGWTVRGCIDGKTYYMPRRTTKKLRAVYADIVSVRIKGARELHAMFCNDGGTRAKTPAPGFSTRILFTSWEWIGETLVLSVPIGADFIPDGSRKLRMSEYWAMKESEAETEEAHG